MTLFVEIALFEVRRDVRLRHEDGNAVIDLLLVRIELLARLLHLSHHCQQILSEILIHSHSLLIIGLVGIQEGRQTLSKVEPRTRVHLTQILLKRSVTVRELATRVSQVRGDLLRVLRLLRLLLRVLGRLLGRTGLIAI